MSDPWFKFYAADYLLDEEVDLLSLEAQGILIRLWCLCWRAGIIPDDPSVLALRTKVSASKLAKNWSKLRLFFQEVEGGLQSDRMENERAGSRALSEARRMGAQKTNSKRWGERSLSDTPAIAERVAERVAQVSVSESESDTEITTPLPPAVAGESRDGKPASRKRRSRDEIAAPYPEPVREVVNAALRPGFWPREDPDGRIITPDPARLCANVARILKEHPGIQPGELIAGMEAYTRKPRQRYAAPQFFFGPGERGGSDPHWLAEYRLIKHRESQAPRVLTLAEES